VDLSAARAARADGRPNALAQTCEGSQEAQIAAAVQAMLQRWGWLRHAPQRGDFLGARCRSLCQ
jgi:hypothetical protein